MDHSSHKNPEISSWSTQGAGQKDSSRCGKKWPDGLKKIQSNTSVPNQEFKEIPYKVGPPNDS